MKKVINVKWNAFNEEGIIVDENEFSNTRPLYNHIKEYVGYYEYASYSGYYRFYKDVAISYITLDTGVEVRKINGVDWYVEITE